MNYGMSAKGGSAFGGKTQINPRTVSRFRFFSKVFAALVSLIGALAVCGWRFDVEILKRVAPALPVIAPNTACAFVLIGLLILIIGWSEKGHKTLRRLVGFFSLIIAALGAATLAEYVFGPDLGIDRLFFLRETGEKVVRMSPQSALNFLLVGLALSLYSVGTRRSVLWGQILIAAGGITALVSLLGFAYGVPGLYTIASYKGMAGHTAVAFVLTFFAILIFRPGAGLVRIFVLRGLSGAAARRLIVALLAILLLETLGMLGSRLGLYNFAYEALFHFLVISGVFVFLIFYSFRSLDRLAEAEKSLEHLREIDRAKTEFVSLASHQLRTPLTSVSWFSEMLMKQEVGELNAKQKEYLAEIYSQNRRMIDLVDDLLNSSRIDMGMLLVEPKPVDLKAIAESVLLEMSPMIKEKSMQIEKNFESGLLDAQVDPELARIIFQNLLSNAVKYTPEKGKVSVSLSRTGSRIEIKIADTGYGIPKDQQHRIFTKMFRADNIRKKVTDGSGLGLYIARAIVKKSGGKIRFESAENKGTTFFVALPAA